MAQATVWGAGQEPALHLGYDHKRLTNASKNASTYSCIRPAFVKFIRIKQHAY